MLGSATHYRKENNCRGIYANPYFNSIVYRRIDGSRFMPYFSSCSGMEGNDGQEIDQGRNQEFHSMPSHECNQYENLRREYLPISIHAHMECNAHQPGTDSGIAISIHALTWSATCPPRGERLPRLSGPVWHHADFNPRPPHRERPHRLMPIILIWNFNPRPPHRERPKFERDKVRRGEFQSTPSSQRATFSTR